MEVRRRPRYVVREVIRSAAEPCAREAGPSAPVVGAPA